MSSQMVDDKPVVWKRIPMPADLLDQVDEVYRDAGYTSKSEFVRDAVRRRVREIERGKVD